jgi:hypothetical protein
MRNRNRLVAFLLFPIAVTLWGVGWMLIYLGVHEWNKYLRKNVHGVKVKTPEELLTKMVSKSGTVIPVAKTCPMNQM